MVEPPEKSPVLSLPLPSPYGLVATSAAFAACINTLTGLDMLTSIIITAILIFIFLTSEGMFSLATTQTADFFVCISMFLIIAYAVTIGPGWDKVFTLHL